MDFDEIGYWSEIKLDIIREYAKTYSTIMSAQTNPTFHHIYIDAFAGAGLHYSKTKEDIIPGSPINALKIIPPFREFHLIDLDGEKTEFLKELTSNYKNVQVYNEDCNKILLEKVFPNCLYKDYKRALCLLDPYGLHLNWNVIYNAGQMKSVEIFLNFPVADMNRNVLWNNPDNVDNSQINRMNSFWGDESWQKAAYGTESNLFGLLEKTDNLTVAKAFQKRLKEKAGFSYVPDPIPMRNTNGAVIYYLFFASQKPVAADIVRQIFGKYRNKGKK
ncbi:MAG: three-Cys-motif partner protein TcmP [Bacteroidota bacterium]|nr:three-Cys-motif partner protein TcmP [Bacteroidota bacterium]